MNGAIKTRAIEGPAHRWKVCPDSFGGTGISRLCRAWLVGKGAAAGNGRTVQRAQQWRPDSRPCRPQGPRMAAINLAGSDCGAGSRRIHRPNSARRPQQLQPVRGDVAAYRRMPRQGAGSWNGHDRTAEPVAHTGGCIIHPPAPYANVCQFFPSPVIGLGGGSLARNSGYPSEKSAQPSPEIGLVRPVFAPEVARKSGPYKNLSIAVRVCSMRSMGRNTGLTPMNTDPKEAA